MIEPEVTAVLGRRYLAFLIDGSLVAATGLGVAYQQSMAFGIVGRDNSDSPLVDPAEFDNMSTMLDFELFGRSEIFGVSVVRAQEIGDSVRVFGADSYQWGAIAALLAALVVFMIIPALIQRTIGMLPLNLIILDREGGQAGMLAHVKRTVFGAVDVLPVVIPGLAGMMIAGASPLHQRLGDRIAGTVVADRKTAAFRARVADTQSISLDLRRAADTGTIDANDLAVEAPGVEPEDSRSDEPIRVDRSQPGPATGLTIADAPIPAAPLEEASIADDHLAAPHPAPPLVGGEMLGEEIAASDSEPTDADDVLLPPPPTHRRPPAAGEVDSPTAGSIGASGSSPAEHETVEAPAATTDSEHVAEPWQPPRSEPAPVWQPSPLDPAPVETLDPHDGRTLDDVELSGIGELITADAFGHDTSPTDDANDVPEQDHVTDSAEQEGSTPPVWSDKWRAWMYWDASKKCWLRHDTENNVWVPVD